MGTGPRNDGSTVGRFPCLKKLGISLLTILIFAGFVGAIFGVGYATGAFDDEFQWTLMIKVVVPLLATSMIFILPAMIMQDRITASFLKNMSDGEDSVKRAVQSSAANISLVCALVATIAIPLMFVDGPQNDNENDILWFYWYYGLASIAASNSFAGMIMGILVLMYTDPLSNDSTLAFVREFKGSIGLPFALLTGSCIFLMAAFACHTMYLYDMVFFICHTAEFVGVAFCVVLFQYYCSKYKNNRDSYVDYEKGLWGQDGAKEKGVRASEYLKSLSSADLAQEMRKNSKPKAASDEGEDAFEAAAAAFESQSISGKMLSDLTYEIVADILEREGKKLNIGDIIQVCSNLGVTIR